jgi:ribosomal protein S2
MAKTYDLVKKVLIDSEQARNSDKECIWQVYKRIGAVKDVEWFGQREAIIKENFLSGKLPSFETIRRSRQKIQELHEELKATSSQVRKRRKQLEDQRGTHIFRDIYEN